MVPDTTPLSGPVSDPAEVMASLDCDGPEEVLVIADVTGDDAWISMPVSGSAELSAWR